MMKNKTIALAVILMFALALGAGVVAGKLSTRLPANGLATSPEKGTLSELLRLKPDQRDKMREIWESVSATSRDCLDQARQVQHDQDAALMGMLNERQQAQYKALSEQTAQKIAVLDEKRKSAFRQAVEKTLPILDDGQRQVYQQIIRDRGVLPDAAGDTPPQNAEHL